MKKILLGLMTTPLLITSCFERPDNDLFVQRFDGHVEGVAYNNDDATLATVRTRADVKVTNGLFDHVKIERDQYIAREWVTVASWNPALDNFGAPTLNTDAIDQHANQYTVDQFNTEGRDFVTAGNNGKSFVYPSQSIFSDYNLNDDLYFYPIGSYSLKIEADILYASIIGSISSRQTYEDIVDLTPYLLPDGSIDEQYTIGEVFDWKINQTLSQYGYVGDIADSPFIEVGGSITTRGVFRDVDHGTSLQQFLRMIDLDHTTSSHIYGRHSNEGWVGNYGNINNFFNGKSVDTFSTLWDRVNIGTSIPGEDVIKDVENTISGSTTSMSRENGAFQNALIKLGKDIELDGILWE